jgi:hypothetical protein
MVRTQERSNWNSHIFAWIHSALHPYLWLISNYRESFSKCHPLLGHFVSKLKSLQITWQIATGAGATYFNYEF